MKKTAAIILAAGEARRFGSPKQLLEFESETLLDRACRLAKEAGCEVVVRVLGAHADAVLERSSPAYVVTVVNEAWMTGMGGSLALGARTALETDPTCEAVLILLCDQPGVEVGLLREILGCLDRASIVLSDTGEATGPPSAFSHEHFHALLELQGDQGAKSIVRAHPDQVVTVAFAGARWDIDSEDEWRRFRDARDSSES